MKHLPAWFYDSGEAEGGKKTGGKGRRGEKILKSI
jgi:hypothetical protein